MHSDGASCAERSSIQDTSMQHELIVHADLTLPTAEVVTCQCIHFRLRLLFVGTSSGSVVAFHLVPAGLQSALNGTPAFVLKGHSGTIRCMLLTHAAGIGTDGWLLMSGGDDHTVRVWDPSAEVQEVCTLRGHSDAVSCLAYCEGVLVTASNDCTLRLWRHEECHGLLFYPWLSPHTCHGAPIVTCTFSEWEHSAHHRVLLTASEDRCFKLWSVVRDSSAREIADHPRAGTADCFGDHVDGHVGDGDDGSGKVCVLLESSLPPGRAVVVSAALHPQLPQFLICDAQGVIHCYELPRLRTSTGLAVQPPPDALVGCRCTHRLDVARLATRVSCTDMQTVLAPTPDASAPQCGPGITGPPHGAGAVDTADDTTAELGSAILRTAYIALPPTKVFAALRQRPADHEATNAGGGSVERWGVLAALPGATVLVDAGSWERLPMLLAGSNAIASEVAGSCDICFNPGHSLCSATEGEGNDVETACNDSTTATGRECWIARASAFQPNVRILRLAQTQPDRTSLLPGESLTSPTAYVDAMKGAHAVHRDRAPADGYGHLAAQPPALSVLPTRPPQRGSPLSKALHAQIGASAASAHAALGRAGARCPNASARTPIGDKPVMFHRKVASSGYGRPPVQKLHSGGPSTAAAAARAAASVMPARGVCRPLVRRYCPAEGPMTYLQGSNSDAAPPLGAPALRLTYAPDASRLAVATTDGSCSVLRLPTRRYHTSASQPPPTLVGHTGAIHSLHWSHSGRLLLTASADGSASMWDVSPDSKPAAAPLLRMLHVEQPEPSGSSTSHPLFGSEIRGARFFYLDQFLILAAGNSMYLYGYSVQRTPSNDAVRAPELRHRYKLQHKWQLPHAQYVTCFTAANSFLSSLVLAAGSDRSLCAFDLGVGKTVLELPDLHERPCQALRLHEHATPEDTAAVGHDLFLTSALDGVVKLWDLRSAACVRRFAAHSNRHHPVGVALSPCLRFVCCGSEDHSAYLYDARSGGMIEQLRHTDAVVSDVAFNPLYPALALAGLDGHVCFYADQPE